MDRRSKKLLQEFIRQQHLLNELGDNLGAIPFDVKDLTGLTSPFADAANVTVGSLKKVFSKAVKVGQTSLTGIPASLNPFIRASYQKVERDDEERMAKVQKKYGEVIEKARKIFEDETELGLFMLNPTNMLAKKLTEQTAEEVYEILQVVSSSAPRLKSPLQALSSRFNLDESFKLRNLLILEEPRFGGSAANDSTAISDDSSDPKKEKQFYQAMVDFFNNSDYIDAFNESTVISGMRRDTIAAKNESLNRLLQIAEDAYDADYQTFKNLFNKKDLDIENEDKEEALFITKAKIIGHYIEIFQKNLELIEEAGGDESFLLVKAYQNAISRLEFLLANLKN